MKKHCARGPIMKIAQQKRKLNELNILIVEFNKSRTIFIFI